MLDTIFQTPAMSVRHTKLEDTSATSLVSYDVSLKAGTPLENLVTEVGAF